MDSFRDTTDYLMGEGVTLDVIADAFAVTANTVNRWRMEGHPMLPPVGWGEVMEHLLSAHAENMKERALVAHRTARAFVACRRALSTGAGK